MPNGHPWTKETFFANTIRDGADNCWIWAGAKCRSSGGTLRGHTSLDGKQDAAHRIAYRLAYGSIPHGKQINHKCNIELCIRPSHIYAGTQADNVVDSMEMRAGNRKKDVLARKVAWSRRYRKWRNENICDLYRSGMFFLKEIGAMFSLDKSAVSLIVRGKR